MRAGWLALGLAACGVETASSGQLPPRYAESCANCHEAGAADAPRRGDEQDWSIRRSRGLPALVERVRQGTTAMPPRGLCYGCSDAELETLVRFVSGAR
jgi:cytochrome c5